MSYAISRAHLNSLPEAARLAAFIFKTPLAPSAPPMPEPDATPLSTLFECSAYALGQFCMPYSVPVRRLRVARRVH